MTGRHEERDGGVGLARSWSVKAHLDRPAGIWLAVMAVVSYVPLLLTQPGRVAADTKQYLYIDPARLTRSAASMWDPNVGMGTVTHQNIGYLWPMGPYFTVAQWIGAPVWVAQRVWMGSLVLAAGVGAAWCARQLGVARAGAAVAGFAYMLSPYMIDYLARTSAIVMPWAALGWLLSFTIIAARSQRWRPVAAFAFVVCFVGGVNATSIALVGLAPVLWLVYAVVATGEVRPGAAVRTALRLGAASLAVSVWWIVGLLIEDSYGLNILRVTETVATVAHTSSAAEVLRGLGYWYFYGWDKVQPWTMASIPYTQSLWLIGVGFAIPAVSVALGWLGRWRYRSFAITMLIAGALIAVGAYPYNRPSLVGKIIESASSGSVLALAMRSVDRIVPLVVLGLALLMGAGVAALRVRRPSAGTATALLCVGLVAADIPPLWTGQLVASNLSRPTQIPSYWYQAASYLNAQGSSTRVLGLPGEDFGAYSWGVTEDPIPPGLLTRPYVARQVVPAGTPAAVNLLQSLDEPLQEGSLNFATLAPLARMMSVGSILLQSDLQYERYNLPLPQTLWQDFTPTPLGLTAPVPFGAPNPAPQIRYPMDNEARLALPPGAPQPPALAVFGVKGTRPIVRTEAVAAPLLLDGDGRGVVEAAATGLLNGNPTLLYSAALPGNAGGFAQAMRNGARLVITDSNLRAGQRWGTLDDNIGAVQGLAKPLVPDPTDYMMPVFPGTGSASQTIATITGVSAVRATEYGNPVTYTPEDQPFNAIDGNPSTAWTFGAHSAIGGQRIRIDLSSSVRIDHIRLLQAAGTRHLTAVTVELNGRAVRRVNLTAASLTGQGQLVAFPSQVVNRVDVIADGATGGAHKRYDGLGSVGLAEITIPGVAPAQEALRLPTDLLSRAGAASLTHPLTILLSRIRAPKAPRTDPEAQISRTFTLPTARTFAVGGSAEIATTAPDPVISQLTGSYQPPSSAGAEIVSASSSGRLIGDRSAGAMAAVDGNPATAWVPETGPQVGGWVQYQFNRPVTLDHLDLQLINDGRHSVPTRLTLTVGSTTRTVDVPAVPDGAGRPQGATSAVQVSFAPVTGSSVRVTIDAVRQVRALDYYATYTGATDLLPVGIAELGLPARAPATPTQIPTVCRSDLLRVDGHAVPVAISGSSSTALGGGQLSLVGCGADAAGLHLSAGPHTIETAGPAPSGWSIDNLTFNSAAGGGPQSLAAVSTTAATPAGGGAQPPALTVTHQNQTSTTVKVNGNGRPFWLILGQSLSKGWKATLPGGRSLGPPTLIDGYANGWYVPAGLISSPTTIQIQWMPQQIVWVAIAISAVSLTTLTVVAVLPSPALTTRRGKKRRRIRMGAGALRVNGAPRPSARLATAVTLGFGVIVGAADRPATGVVALAAALVAGRWGRWRTILRAAAVAAFLLVGVYVVVQQYRWRYWPSIDWPADLSSANDLAWLALALTGADVCAGLRLRSRRRDPSEPEAPKL